MSLRYTESESCSVVTDSLLPHGLYSLWNSPGQNTGVGSLSLLQGIFPTQRLNPGLPHCRQILYQLSHQGSPRILEWVPCPFSRGSPRPGIELGSPELQEDSLPTSYEGSPQIQIQEYLLLSITEGQPEIQQKLRIFGLLPNGWFCFSIFLHFASI